MFRFINDILEQILPCFNRQASWVNFCAIIIGFIMRPDVQGVSSVISVLRIKPERCTARLKFFRSTSFDIDRLYQKLITLCMRILPPKTVDGRVIPGGGPYKSIERRPQDAGHTEASPGITELGERNVHRRPSVRLYQYDTPRF
jgi:hypothetical protein